MSEDDALEQERLRDLHRLGVLDTESERRFDRITRLVAEVLDFPTVLISLVDENRQWFKSAHNLEVKETARDIAFCAHAIHQEDGALIIPDARTDARFQFNPLVTGAPHIRAYAGIVLRSPRRLAMGTLCAIDFKPREIRPHEVDLLRRFAELAEAELLRNVSGDPWREHPPALPSDPGAPAMPAAQFRAAADELCRVTPSGQLAMLVLDLPKLHQIRRTFGREIGDEVRLEVARRMHLALSNRRFLLGTDDEHQFVALIHLGQQNDTLKILAEDLKFSLDNRVQTSTVTVSTPISIGIAEVERDEDGIETAMQRALLARYAFRSTPGGAHVNIFRQEMHRRFIRRNAIAARLHEAFEADKMSVYFQPKVRIRDDRIIGAEALIRWVDEDLGYVAPAEIIEAAQEIDQVLALDEWVFKQACRALATWQAQGIELVPVSINFSGETLSRPDFVDWTCRVIHDHALPPQTIGFEILESAVLENLSEIVDKILACQKLGISFSLDDFGIGQSSLAYLQSLPVDHLKIDRSFITDIVHDLARSTMARQIIEIGHALGKQVIAEGVENIGQYLILRSFGGDAVQGYFFAEPMPATTFAGHLATENAVLPPPGLENF